LWATDAESGETAAIEAIQGGLIDGVVFTSATEGSESLRSALRLELPVVSVIRSIEGVRCDQVTSDNRAGGRLAAEHFLAAGRTDVAVIGGGDEVSTGRERREGFVSTLRAHGAAVPADHLVDVDFEHDSAKDAARRLFDRVDGPRSLFCVNDVIAFGVLDAAKHCNLVPPKDVWVIGYDDVRMASWDLFDLTTLTQPVGPMADAAITMLTNRIADRTLPFEHQRFVPELRARGTAPLIG